MKSDQEDDAIDVVLAAIKTPDFASFNRDTKPFFRYDFTRRNDGSIPSGEWVVKEVIERAEEVKPKAGSDGSTNA